jgi:L-rhamnonate dehydratase
LKITEISAVCLDVPTREPVTEPRRPSWWESCEVVNPMSRYPHVKRHRDMWSPKKWGAVWCKVTLEDGTWGLGQAPHGRVVAAIIDDHLAPQLVGQEIHAIEKLADMMFRLTKPYGSGGLASNAISAVDLGCWDALGRLLQKPVYELLGGAQKDRIFCYATGNDVDWYLELGYSAFKLACPYGPVDGLDGLQKNEELIARTRELVGDSCELMLDCWMGFDVDYTVRLAERLRPYDLKWMEECLIPEDLDGHVALRQQLPWQTLSTGEHWYTHMPFQWAATHRVVDILQPDIRWAGGMSTCRKIANIADAAGLSVILHGGGGSAYGQHFSAAFAAVPWLECFTASAPGVPLEELTTLPGQVVPRDGWLTPSDVPGFGLDIPESWIRPFSYT